MIRILFVCLGNICRSPSAEGVCRALIEREGLGDRVQVESAGTHSYHTGKPPDRRAQRAAAGRGLDLSPLRARRATREDFQRFDYVIAMDRENAADLKRICPPGAEDRLARLMDFAPERGERDVPDPYYGGAEGFETMLDLIEAGVRGLLDHLRRHHFDDGR